MTIRTSMLSHVGVHLQLKHTFLIGERQLEVVKLAHPSFIFLTTKIASKKSLIPQQFAFLKPLLPSYFMSKPFWACQSCDNHYHFKLKTQNFTYDSHSVIHTHGAKNNVRAEDIPVSKKSNRERYVIAK